jgi:hypothetical protein
MDRQFHLMTTRLNKFIINIIFNLQSNQIIYKK